MVIGKHRGLCLLLGLFLLVAAFVNPIRETLIADDWAYSLTVRNVLQTGEYHLHDWATANMPVQIYWGALLAKVFGYSFTVLRLSTLGLLLVALISLYKLLQDFAIPDMEASLLTLAVFSSPIVLFLSFTFQTDVQFLGWQILALWLYTRALRDESYALMVLGAIAAAAAIGTRQFGVALLAGLLATWLFFEQDRVRKLSLYLIGLVLPSTAAIWQIYLGANHPTFSQKVRLTEQVNAILDWPVFAGDILWRPAAIIVYLGLYFLPLLPVLGVLACKALTAQRRGSHEEESLSARPWLLAGCAIYLLAGIAYGCWHRHEVLIPFIDWLLRHSGVLEPLLPTDLSKRIALTILAYVFALIWAWLLGQRYLTQSAWRKLPQAEWFLVMSAVAALAIQLIYVQFYDVYLIQFLPFAAFALGRLLSVWPRWCRALTAALCLLMLFVSALWTRGNLTHAKASWRAAEAARAAGAEPRDVGGNRTWSCYYGAFDEWVARVGGLGATSQYSGANRMHPIFFDFLAKRDAGAKYAISSSGPKTADPIWNLVRKFEYRDKWLRRRDLYLLMRKPRKTDRAPRSCRLP